jgi:hypothetical protein
MAVEAYSNQVAIHSLGSLIAEDLVNEPTYSNHIELSSSTIVAVYNDTTTGVAKVIAGNKPSDFAIEWGTPVTFNAGLCAFPIVVAVSATKFAIVYRDTANSNYGTAIAGTVSTNTITLGTKSTFNAAATTPVGAVGMDTDKFLITYDNNLASGQAKVATLSGTTLTFGTAFTFSSDTLKTGAFRPSQITTTSASSSFSVSQGASLVGIKFSSDGTKMYILDNGTTDTVYQYTLSTAWDVSTASYASKSFSVNSQSTSSWDVVFSADGTKMYISSQAPSYKIYQYTLATAWDVSTASYASKSWDGNSQYPSFFALSADGTKLYVINNSSLSLYQYALSTAWDISTTAAVGSHTAVITPPSIVGSNYMSSSTRGLYFDPNGTFFLVTDSGTDKLVRFNLPTPWQLLGASFHSATNDSIITMGLTTQDAWGIYMKPDGKKVYIVGANVSLVYQISLDNAEKLSTYQLDKLSTTSAVVVYADGSGNEVAEVLDISGTTVTGNTAYRFITSTTLLSDMLVKSLSSSRFVVVACQAINNGCQGYIYGIIGDVSGSTGSQSVSFGATSTIVNALSIYTPQFRNIRSLAVVSSTKFMFSTFYYASGTIVGDHYLYACSISGTTINVSTSNFSLYNAFCKPVGNLVNPGIPSLTLSGTNALTLSYINSYGQFVCCMVSQLGVNLSVNPMCYRVATAGAGEQIELSSVYLCSSSYFSPITSGGNTGSLPALYLNGTKSSNRFYNNIGDTFSPPAIGSTGHYIMPKTVPIIIPSSPIILKAGETLWASLGNIPSSTGEKGSCTAFGLKRT